jgi:predicted DNA-binding transcriptional regulator AlpA
VSQQLIRLSVLAKKWGISRASMTRLVRRPDFPAVFQLGAQIAAVDEASATAWLLRQQRGRPTDATQP